MQLDWGNALAPNKIAVTLAITICNFVAPITWHMLHFVRQIVETLLIFLAVIVGFTVGKVCER